MFRYNHRFLDIIEEKKSFFIFLKDKTEIFFPYQKAFVNSFTFSEATKRYQK